MTSSSYQTDSLLRCFGNRSMASFSTSARRDDFSRSAGDDFERLRRTADRAMYADKRRKGVVAAPRKRTKATAAGTE
ncbi:hypothetical protein [Antrihabitans stalactiti]|uniref:Uncharacterized protein n=1 Tax=Antrihabitans stalactiti TaxID=2584121 RepID=A0A848KG67_9NOCA|nr:hypothetical protein [Antrihabitans stalactiti]NMN97289.1 hypothetical protein [Antrihabitans stalactiti]